MINFWPHRSLYQSRKHAHKHTQIKLLIENELIICALGNLHYKISREKFEPEPARNPEVRGSNPGSGSIFSLEIL